MPKKLKQFQTIGSFEDFVSRRFKTIVVSHCKTLNVESGGPLFSHGMIEFILSRVVQSADTRVIVIAKQDGINQVWKHTFTGKNVELIER